VLHRKQLSLAFFFGHFFLILVVCCRDTLALVAAGYTFLPGSLNAYWQKAEEISSTGLGRNLDLSHPARQAVSIYTRLAGIESGYTFFAPNVPDNYKLVFELHYPDGRVEYELPQVASGGGGLRLATLLDNLGETRYDALREVMVKMMAYAIWRKHPDAAMIRAVLGWVILPTVAEFQQGKRESYEFLYAYDFRFPVSSGKAEVP
jgi:hypothetical protein